MLCYLKHHLAAIKAHRTLERRNISRTLLNSIFKYLIGVYNAKMETYLNENSITILPLTKQNTLTKCKRLNRTY